MKESYSRDEFKDKFTWDGKRFIDRQAKPTEHKYKAAPTIYNGVRYDSKAEAERAKELDLLKRAGDIHDWKGQVHFILGDINYRADFLILGTDGEIWIEDVKGMETDRFRIVRKLWKKYGPLPLHILKRKGKQWNTEIIRGIE